MTNPHVQAVAKAYHQAHEKALGLPPWSDAPARITVDADRGRLAAAAYDALPHDPNDPKVKAAYDALKAETYAQYKHAIASGLKIEPWMKAGPPYTSSAHMAADVRENNHLYYFPSSNGFGQEDASDHPLMEQSPAGVPYNDLFRAVHDYYAHAMHGHQFGPTGELRAWVEHARMFSPLARKALTTETHGQNSWVNFGPHSGKPVTERPYAEQKAAILPEEHAPQRFARTRFNSQASGVSAQLSDNHAARVSVAKRILREAGLRASVRSVLAHTDERGVRPGVAAVLHHDAPDDLVHYATAWLGMMTSEPRMTVFRPGEGDDTLHMITTRRSAQDVGDYLRRAGIPRFSLDTSHGGTRAFIVNPGDVLDIPSAARGLGGEHQEIRGRATRFGTAGDDDSDARARYRHVIRHAERAAGVSAGPESPL